MDSGTRKGTRTMADKFRWEKDRQKQKARTGIRDEPDDETLQRYGRPPAKEAPPRYVATTPDGRNHYLCQSLQNGRRVCGNCIGIRIRGNTNHPSPFENSLSPSAVLCPTCLAKIQPKTWQQLTNYPFDTPYQRRR